MTAQQFKTIRTETLKLSQFEMAQKLGLKDPSAISLKENGKRGITGRDKIIIDQLLKELNKKE